MPCSGSGTWARTPEQMYFFMEEVMNELNETQQDIANNIQAFLKPGGRLLYKTCSVFKKENEYIANNIDGVKMKEMHLINGISINADSMYMTIFEKEG